MIPGTHHRLNPPRIRTIYILYDLTQRHCDTNVDPVSLNDLPHRIPVTHTDYRSPMFSQDVGPISDFIEEEWDDVVAPAEDGLRTRLENVNALERGR